MAPKIVLALAIFAMQGSLHAQPGSWKNLVRPSGLQPSFPAHVRCPQIASPYGSQTRYDGSYRPQSALGGYHGGIDISLAEGTPLLALAAGTVASKGEGGMMEGIYLWLRHSPEDTGLQYWVYSKYQHLESLPELEIGAKVAVGQAIARPGRTGTVGGHYGASGYPHLHLGTGRSPSGEASVGSRGEARGLRLFDPLALYQATVTIPYVGSDGKVTPQSTRVVWPVACQPIPSRCRTCLRQIFDLP